MVSGKITDEEAVKAKNGELDKILDRWEKATKPLRRKMKTLITEYIRNSDYDGIHLKRNLMTARLSTVMRLAEALGCKVEELI